MLRRPTARVILLAFSYGVLAADKESLWLAGTKKHGARGAKLKASSKLRTDAGTAGADDNSPSGRMARAVGRMHLTMLEWYCVENAESHSATVPCENYLRMTKMVAARDKSEREAVTKAFAAVAPKTEEEMADRVRLVKGACEPTNSVSPTSSYTGALGQNAHNSFPFACRHPTCVASLVPPPSHRHSDEGRVLQCPSPSSCMRQPRSGTGVR